MGRVLSRASWAVWGVLALGLSGCYSLSPTAIDRELAPRKGESVSYLVGVVGVWPDSAYGAHEQSILIRRPGEQASASARLVNRVSTRTKRDLRETKRGIGTLFVMPLKPGRYEIHNVLFRWQSSTRKSRKDFSIPLLLEPGKAYYVGDFRAACMQVRTLCTFLHSSHLERDQALVRENYPELPALQPVELEQMESAFPVLVQESDPRAAGLKATLSQSRSLSSPEGMALARTLVGSPGVSEKERKARAALMARLLENRAASIKPVIHAVNSPMPELPVGMTEGGAREVILNFIVRADGTVHSVQARESGQPELEKAAVDAVSLWRFQPWQVKKDIRAEWPLSKTFVFDSGRVAKLAKEPNIVDALLGQPCSAITAEVAQFRRDHPDGPLKDVDSFRQTSGLLFLISLSVSADVQDVSLLSNSFQAAVPWIVEQCEANPESTYQTYVVQALRGE